MAGQTLKKGDRVHLVVWGKDKGLATFQRYTRNGYAVVVADGNKSSSTYHTSFVLPLEGHNNKGESMNTYLVYFMDYPEEGTLIEASSPDAAISQHLADCGTPEVDHDDLHAVLQPAEGEEQRNEQ